MRMLPTAELQPCQLRDYDNHRVGALHRSNRECVAHESHDSSYDTVAADGRSEHTDASARPERHEILGLKRNAPPDGGERRNEANGPTQSCSAHSELRDQGDD